MKLSGVFQRMKYNFLNKEIFRQHKYVFKFLNKGIHSGYQNTMPRTVNMKYGDKVNICNLKIFKGYAFCKKRLFSK